MYLGFRALALCLAANSKSSRSHTFTRAVGLASAWDSPTEGPGVRVSPPHSFSSQGLLFFLNNRVCLNCIWAHWISSMLWNKINFRAGEGGICSWGQEAQEMGVGRMEPVGEGRALGAVTPPARYLEVLMWGECKDVSVGSPSGVSHGRRSFLWQCLEDAVNNFYFLPCCYLEMSLVDIINSNNKHMY